MCQLLYLITRGCLHLFAKYLHIPYFLMIDSFVFISNPRDSMLIFQPFLEWKYPFHGIDPNQCLSTHTSLPPHFFPCLPHPPFYPLTQSTESEYNVDKFELAASLYLNQL
jgi:hypothetical protein